MTKLENGRLTRWIAKVIAWLPTAGLLSDAGIAEVSHLFAIRKPLIVWLALLALVLGQSAAGLHALKHLGSGSDATGGPAQHVQLCLECASFTPLAAVHGAPAHGLLVAFVAVAGVLPVLDAVCAAGRRAVPFQARAPPR